MNLIACIFKRTSAIFTLLILLIGYAPISQACPPPPPGYWKSLELYKKLSGSYRNTQGYVNPKPKSEILRTYLRVSPLEELIDDAEIIFIGTPKFNPAGAIPYDPNRDYLTVTFKVKEGLKGKSLRYFTYATPQDGIVAILNVEKSSQEIKDNFTTFREQEKRKIELHNEVGFWDFSQLNTLSSYDEAHRGTSCGAFSTPMLTKGQSYIFIATRTEVIIEPVANKNDMLVSAIKARLEKPFERMGPTLSVGQFMRKMDHVKVLETEICQDNRVERISFEKVLSESSEDKLPATLYSEMLNEYFSQTRKKHICQQGQKYLLYGYNDIPNYFGSESLAFRFARIKNRDILLDDIATHLILIDDPISIDRLEQLLK